ncbi:hypothetical protein N657DRAFT_698317, partial [Parathielavia appendiculata]
KKGVKLVAWKFLNGTLQTEIWQSLHQRLSSPPCLLGRPLSTQTPFWAGVRSVLVKSREFRAVDRHSLLSVDMRFFFSLSALLLALFSASQVNAESEHAHAAERVFAYLLYRLEAMAYPNLPFNSKKIWVATDCVRGKARRCSFNESMTWISKGDRSGTPGYYELSTHNLSPTASPAELKTVINTLTTRQDLRDLVKDDFCVANVIGEVGGFKGNGYAKLYSQKYDQFSLYVKEAMDELPEGDNKEAAKKVYGTSRELSAQIITLRRGATSAKLYEELKGVFPETHPSNYYNYVENGVTKRRDPIKWVTVQKTWGTHSWREVDLAATKQANLATRTAIETDIDKRIQMFHADNPRLITWNPTYQRSNQNHQAVIDHMNEMRKQGGWSDC